MGIYDRDYYREQEPSFSVRAPRTIVVTLILINVAIWLANALLTPPPRQDPANPARLEAPRKLGRITEALSVTDNTLRNPLLWWQFLTYGFAHDTQPFHVLFNMLQLWFLGRTVEQLYGRGEFLRLYLVMLVVCSLVWAVTNALFDPGGHRLIGASGAVLGMVILFVLNLPQQTLILFPIPIPIKAWVIGVVLVVANLLGATAQTELSGNTAYTVHLTGMAFAFLYFRNRWNLGWLDWSLFSRSWLKRRPKLRIHDPAREQAELDGEVDRILEKIQRQGEQSLTRKERRTLETASREYQRRRRG